MDLVWLGLGTKTTRLGLGKDHAVPLDEITTFSFHVHYNSKSSTGHLLKSPLTLGHKRESLLLLHDRGNSRGDTRASPEVERQALKLVFAAAKPFNDKVKCCTAGPKILLETIPFRFRSIYYNNILKVQKRPNTKLVFEYPHSN